MKIDKIIKQLQDIQEKHGNIEVKVKNPMCLGDTFVLVKQTRVWNPQTKPFVSVE